MPDSKKKKVAIQKTSKPSWSDAGLLMKKGATEADINTQRMIIALSVAFDIPPQGITILADNPYINKQGLEFVFDKFKTDKGWGYFISKPVEIAKQAGDTAVFVTELYDKDGRMVANGYGSANAANIRMGPIKVFLNEMAETRSQNRCLRKILSPILYQTFINRVNSLKKEQLELIAETSANFGSVTAEEMVEEETVKSEKLLTETEMKAIAGFLQEINNAKSNSELEMIGSRVSAGTKVGKFNKNQIAVLREAWVGMSQKLAFKEK